jgi:hypothetical protein
MNKHQIIHIKRLPAHGPRVYFCGRRVHHGLDGIILFVAAIVLMWTDRHDAPWWPTKDFLSER